MSSEIRKIKGRIKKFTKRRRNVLGLWLTLILCIIDLSIKYFYKGDSGLSFIILILIIVLFYVMTHDEIMLSTNQIIKVTTKVIDETSQGFRKLPANQFFGELNHLVSTAETSIRIIGDGYAISNKHDSNSIHTFSIQNYLKTIENRLKQSSKQMFVYERITSREINPKSQFYSHLESALDMQIGAGDTQIGKNNSVKIAFAPFFSYAYTYVLVDDKSLIIHIINSGDSDEYETNFICHDSGIIASFVKHFKSNITELKPLQNKEELTFEVKKGQALWKCFKDISDNYRAEKQHELHDLVHAELKEFPAYFIGPHRELRRFGDFTDTTKAIFELYSATREVPLDTLTRKFALREITNCIEKVEEIACRQFTIYHDKDKLSLLKCFAGLISDMSPGDSFSSIVTDRVWNSLSDIEKEDYLETIKDAIEEKKKIERFLIINDSHFLKANGEIIDKSLLESLKEHIKLSKNHEKLYTFNFCVIDEYKYNQRNWDISCILSNIRGKQIVNTQIKYDRNSNHIANIHSTISSMSILRAGDMSKRENKIQREIYEKFNSAYRSVHHELTAQKINNNSNYNKVIKKLGHDLDIIE